jgi:hypothetical protein
MAMRAPQVAVGEYVKFPREADGDFSEVSLQEITEWREKLNKRFGIGQRRLVSVEEPSTKD